MEDISKIFPICAQLLGRDMCTRGHMQSRLRGFHLLIYLHCLRVWLGWRLFRILLLGKCPPGKVLHKVITKFVRVLGM
jgi:hypothetical protein